MSLSFVADMPAYIGLGGLMRITLEIEETETGRQLVLSRQSIDITSDLPPEDNVERAVLVESLDTLAITYFGQIKGDAAPAWYGNWDNTHRNLPNLLQISVEPTGGPAWPVLIASPLMGAEPLEMSVPTSERQGPRQLQRRCNEQTNTRFRPDPGHLGTGPAFKPGRRIRIRRAP